MTVTESVRLLIGTRKGGFYLSSDPARKNWKVSEPTFLGHVIYHLLHDARDPRRMMMAAKTGHLGPTVFRSEDGGATWKEAKVPPAFPAIDEEKARAVDLVFWLSAGHNDEPGVWYAGTSPPGVFRSEDHGETWKPVSGFNEASQYKEWTSQGATPGGQMVHSIIVDPRDRQHMYLGISVGGAFESVDGGANWQPINDGCAADFIPDDTVAFGHDPHTIIMHPARPDRLFQQNHCGIYRLDRPGTKWTRVGKAMPREIGDIGFPIVADPLNQDRVWVFPMDGTDVWPRTSPGGKPAVYTTVDAGESWRRQDSGLPPQDAYFTVKRQSMCVDNRKSLGIYFGTTSGEVWGSIDEGETWNCLVRYLPEIYSLSAMSGTP